MEHYCGYGQLHNRTTKRQRYTGQPNNRRTEHTHVRPRSGDVLLHPGLSVRAGGQWSGDLRRLQEDLHAELDQPVPGQPERGGHPRHPGLHAHHPGGDVRT